jgi:hypothetical protein
MKWTLGIQFPNAKSWSGKNTVYHYLSNKALALNSTVVVDSPFDGFTCVKVVTCKAWQPEDKATKWIVDVVDSSGYNGRELIATRMTEIERKLNAMVNSMKDNDWKLLRNCNAEARMHYAEYSSLRDTFNGY